MNLPLNLQKSQSPNKGKSPTKDVRNVFPTTPRSQSKQKKMLLRNLKRLMEQNFKLKTQN
jgi:hypothetical protein